MTEPNRGRNNPYSDPKQLMLIRASLLLGALMFAGVTFFIHKQGGVPPGPPPAELVYVPMIAIAVALLAIFPVRTRWMKATDPVQRFTLGFMGWAFGEAAALAGCVYYFLTDDPKFAITGVFVLLATFMLFPIKRAE